MNQTERSSNSLFRWVGYGLLVLAAFDVVDILLPPQLMNPAWEFRTVGALVERVPVPLLGFALIFYPEANLRGQLEKPILKFLSWATLLIGILYLLLIPLTMSNTWRINSQNNAQAYSQYNQQMAQIQQVKTQLNNAKPQELNQLLNRLNRQGQQLDTANLGQLKTQLASEIAQAERNLRAQAEAARVSRRLVLLKNSAKWNLGALVSGVLFIRIWQLTRWTRYKQRGKRAQPATSS